MGLSHFSILGAHCEVELVAICDTTKYVLDILSKYTGVKSYTDYDAMLAEARLDAVLIATPSTLHGPMVRAALDNGLHVFCEKPFCISAAEGSALAELARTKGLVCQVGYHNRFIASFREVKRLVASGALGQMSHVLAEAYGAVVLKPTVTTWRTQREQGGGCLYDYAAHPINLVNWLLGMPDRVSGAVLNPIFSSETDDEVYATLHYPTGTTAQLSVNWSDPSVRKMTTRLSIWGTAGRLFADRQELQMFLRDDVPHPVGYSPGWNVRYTTELTEPVAFYLRGEEYSAQIDSWLQAIGSRNTDPENSFDSAVVTDATMEQIVRHDGFVPDDERPSTKALPAKRRLTRLLGLS